MTSDINISQRGDVTVMSVGKMPEDDEVAEITAGDAFRESLIFLSDLVRHGAPLWHGWAIMDAFRAGAKWQRGVYGAITEVRIPAGGMFAASMREEFAPAAEVKITASKVGVDPDYHWQPMTTCPLHTKLQLLGKGGLPTYGKWDGKDPFIVGWARIPTRAPE